MSGTDVGYATTRQLERCHFTANTSCNVLVEGIIPPICYARAVLSGTERAPDLLRTADALSGTELGYGAIGESTPIVKDCAIEAAKVAICLRLSAICYAMSGTN
eukprot:1861892-Rhodomonas_salina.2